MRGRDKGRGVGEVVSVGVCVDVGSSSVILGRSMVAVTVVVVIVVVGINQIIYTR